MSPDMSLCRLAGHNARSECDELSAGDGNFSALFELELVEAQSYVQQPSERPA
jgi:hypothetical protein